MTAAPPDLREGLIQSAVKFLSDPKVQESPLNKRLAFLESKGLTQNEIDEALRRVHRQKSAEFNALPADTTATSVADTTTSFAPSLSWKDYTINVLLAGGFGYGLFRLLQHYVKEWLPTRSDLEEEQKLLSKRFEETQKALADVKESAEQRWDGWQTQHLGRLETVLLETQDLLQLMQRIEQTRQDEMDRIRQELTSVKDLVPQIMNKVKDNQVQMLSSVQTELQSLKSLLQRKSLATQSTSSVVPAPASADTPVDNNQLAVVTEKPKLPAWQLESNLGEGFAKEE